MSGKGVVVSILDDGQRNALLLLCLYFVLVVMNSRN